MRFLITAGPTREPLDPVRYLSNRSSGKMGYAIATAAAEAGHQVVLISGPVNLPAPAGVTIHSIQTAQQMWETTRELLRDEAPDIAILAAAVADYRPKFQHDQKIKKHQDSLTLELERTPDILGSMRQPFNFSGLLVGFAAETENLIANAMDKLQRKHCDLIIANDVSGSDTGFDTDQNEVILCFPDGRAETLPRQSKHDLARNLIQRLTALAFAIDKPSS
ncbi:phosphopantothenoylcysteine decarboxylase [Phragmitibacter flavus]|uniref:Phosphopantothenoylcysteine decarboxylase n=1 Tax=Phragmitibacter flavus TaxID=2576071 RepID=A0A5R8KCM7_9BACT|nr:phosphopantothenoylcysteine decarboxylase [Phragmitibacter flavus]TLD70041.1 phosphopantothenoylcysteine decarboxylase [Phragmitibacter flavus]